MEMLKRSSPRGVHLISLSDLGTSLSYTLSCNISQNGSTPSINNLHDSCSSQATRCQDPWYSQKIHDPIWTKSDQNTPKAKLTTRTKVLKNISAWISIWTNISMVQKIMDHSKSSYLALKAYMYLALFRLHFCSIPVCRTLRWLGQPKIN